MANDPPPADDVVPVKVPSKIAKLKYARIRNLGRDIQSTRDAGTEAIKPGADRDPFLGRYVSIKETYDTFMRLWYDLEDYHAEREDTEPEFPDPQQEAVFKAVKARYIEIQTYYVKIQSAIRAEASTAPRLSTLDTGVNASQLNNSRSYLPEINIKVFKGDYGDWPTFKQTYESLIMEDSSLDDAVRFHYLAAYTDGPAYDVIKHITLTRENFTQAWESLCKVYDDKRNIACTYLNRLLAFKPHNGSPNLESLQRYLSEVIESVTCMNHLQIPNFGQYLLCELAIRGLDQKTRDGFETSAVGSDFPTITALENYVRGRCNVMRRTTSSGAPKVAESAKPSVKLAKPPNKFGQIGRHALMAHSTSQLDSNRPPSNVRSCFICKQDHRLPECPKFRDGTPPERLNLLRRFPGCRSCLSPAHKTKDCQSKNRCRKCQAMHHTDLHLEARQGSPDAATPDQPNSAPGTAPTPASFSGHSSSSQAGVLLGTVIADVRGAKGETKRFRGVIDPGSQFSFATELLAKRLNKSTRPYAGAISGVNNSPLKNIKGKITLVLSARGRGMNPLQTDAIVVPTITPFLPQNTVDHDMWQDYLSYDLSDPDFHKSGPIEFLIGADIYPDIVTGAPLVIHEHGPRLMPTVFGFAVIGRFSHNSAEEPSLSLLSFTDLPEIMHRFWETENPIYSPLQSEEDKECERHFVETTYRNQDGRYVVRLPFKTLPPENLINPRVALNRFYCLESKLAKNELLRKEYCAQMQEYIQLQHMSPAQTPPRYVIPHHAVFKEEAGKAKLRIVFDASFSTGAGSLNDYLHTGEKLQADISSILLNFRRFTYVFKCDIVKMFRQVLMDPADRCFQQIIWRQSPADPIQYFELNTVSFGICSSPFQAMRVLQEHARKYEQKYPEAASILLHSTYVDDVTAGSESIQQLLELKSQLIEILKAAGFELSKWNANNPSLLNTGDKPDEFVSLVSEENHSTKILGIHWDPVADSYSYQTSKPPAGFTKRSILSTIARLYDPLGYLGPVVFHAKCTMQQTWASQSSWDAEVSEVVKSRWKEFVQVLPELSKVSIPRRLPISDTTYQLLLFSDASEAGVGAAAYLRATQGASASLALLKSKSRVAPIKLKTIPRLELDGAVLLTEVLQSLESFRKDLAITEVYCFTDSMVVLAWIKTLPCRLQTYVANRVQKIIEIAPAEYWHHVRGTENPADVLSRGILPDKLKDHHLWWSGPNWCSNPTQDWPISSEVPNMEIPELKKTPPTAAMVAVPPEFVEYAQRHSSHTRLIRVVAYLRRFIANARIPKSLKVNRTTGPISSVEFMDANQYYLKLIQHFYYPEVFTATSNNALSAELRKLNVFVDTDGIIRVGGRLRNAPIPPEQKHQILLPDRSFYTTLVIHSLHLKNHHIGPAALLATIQQRYWVPRAKSLIRRIRHKCVICTRYSKARLAPFMGDLPRSRFAGIRPFLISGVDMAGPYLYRESSNRRAATAKAYLCLFTCMSSRAMHLEVTTSLSVEAFLDAFDRFTARRGLPTEIMSDQGTNFCGAARYITETTKWFEDQQVQGEIVSHTAHLGTKWTFNPPYSPHFGGTWEVSVRLVKDLLHKTLGQQPFTLPELTTMFTKIEGVLNSRPLLPVSTSPQDLEVLTPGHFIIGQAINALPEPDFTDIPVNRLNRWQLLRERVQYFWQRWRQEYLNSLQVRQKWDKRNPNLAVGDVVLLLESNSSPAHWPLGRILEVHPGEDSIVRVATIKTARGVYKRPTVKMVRLDLSSIHS